MVGLMDVVTQTQNNQPAEPFLCSDGIYVLDESGDVVVANPSFYHNLGYDPDHPPPLNVAQWDRKFVGGGWNAVLDQLTIGKTYVKECRHRRADGSEMDVEVAFRAMRQQGRIRIHASSRDISERKRGEARLRQSEEKFRLAMRYAPNGIALIDLDGRWVEVNPALCNITGYRPAEMLQRDIQSITHPDDVSLDRVYVDRLLRGEQESYHREKRYIHKQGHTVYVEVNVALARNDKGDPLYFIGQIHDITDRKMAESELQSVASQLGLVLETTAEGIIYLDSHRNVMFANPAAAHILGWPSAAHMPGLPSTEILGHLLPDGTPVDDQTCSIRHAIHNGTTLRINEDAFTRQDGIIIPVEYVVAPLPVDGIVVGAVMAFHNITERKALENDLKRSNAELEQFAYVASHDLRQPLRMISSYLGLIERHLQGTLDDQVGQYLNFALGGAQRMDRLILSLLDYSRVGRTGHTEQVDLNSVIQEAIRNLGRAIHETQATLTVAPGFPQLWGCHLELMRLFQNLIGNAIKYHAPDRPPVILVEWYDQDSQWRITVTDNGIGISEVNRERVFKVFQRLVTQDQYEGTGIGLAICKKIVEQAKGHIGIESPADGVGSCFAITLPK